MFNYFNRFDRPALDMHESKYTCTIQEMENKFNTELNYDGVEFYPGKEDSIKSLVHDYFYFREIGYDTIGQFNFAFNRKMRLMMDVFNRFYEIDDGITDWFENANYTELRETKDNQDITNQRVETGNEKQTGSDTTSEDNTQTTTGSDSTNINGQVENDTQEGGTDTINRNSTDNTQIHIDEQHNGFKVDSSLPQNMVTTDDIMANVWADTAGKFLNHDQGINENILTAESTDTTEFGKTLHSLDKTNSTNQRNTHDEVIGNIERSLDIVRNTDLSRGLNDTGNVSSLNNLVRNIKGNIGNKYLVELVPMLRAAVLNIPQMIIAELETLFLGVW